MSATAVEQRAARAPGFWDTTIGKKAVMAVTGIILFGFVIGHLLGNLQVFLGREKLNHYAELLHSMPGLLWTARIGLIVAAFLHILASVQLALRKKAARPVGYVMRKPTTSSYASRTMYWSGPIVLAFLIYHLLHFTFGVAQPDAYSPTDVYGNVVAGFQVPWISGFYILSMALLCMHLYHGLWSMFQSLGVNTPKLTGVLHRFAQVFALFIFLGNISIPIAVLAGLVGPA